MVRVRVGVRVRVRVGVGVRVRVRVGISHADARTLHTTRAGTLAGVIDAKGL